MKHSSLTGKKISPIGTTKKVDHIQFFYHNDTYESSCRFENFRNKVNLSEHVVLLSWKSMCLE